MRFAKGLALALLVALVLWTAGAAWMRSRGPDPLQAQALATLEAPTPPLPPGANAADAMRLLKHDVPFERRAGLAVALREFEEADAKRAQRGGKETLADPRDAFPARPAIEDAPGLCHLPLTEHDCLATVRADPAATTAILEHHASSLRDTLALADYGGYRHERTPSIYMATPMLPGTQRLVLTHFAHRFATGDVDGALAGTCRDLAGWRRLSADNDSLLAALVTTTYATHDALLLARFVAELPAGHDLPASCADALAPTTAAELDLCPAIRSEFAMVNSLVPSEPPPGISPADRLMLHAVSTDRMRALLAPHYAAYCGGNAMALAVADKAQKAPDHQAWLCGSVERLLDPVDCTLAEVAHGTSFGRYIDRRTDLAATLALLRTIAWLRATDADPRPRADRLAARPESLGLRREATLAADGLSVSIPRLDQRDGATITLPLPLMPVAAITTD
jgi:hypothetical protein